jgi:hypothetical protein
MLRLAAALAVAVAAAPALMPALAQAEAFTEAVLVVDGVRVVVRVETPTPAKPMSAAVGLRQSTEAAELALRLM